MGRQLQSIQETRNFVQIERGDILRPAVLDNLADVPRTLEWIGEINLISAPDDVSWRGNSGHVASLEPWFVGIQADRIDELVTRVQKSIIGLL